VLSIVNLEVGELFRIWWKKKIGWEYWFRLVIWLVVRFDFRLCYYSVICGLSVSIG